MIDLAKLPRFTSCPGCGRHGHLIDENGRVYPEVGSKVTARAMAVRVINAPEDLEEVLDQINACNHLDEEVGEMDMRLRGLEWYCRLIIESLQIGERSVDNVAEIILRRLRDVPRDPHAE